MYVDHTRTKPSQLPAQSPDSAKVLSAETLQGHQAHLCPVQLSGQHAGILQTYDQRFNIMFGKSSCQMYYDPLHAAWVKF